MRIVKMFTALIVIHLGLGFTQLAVSYFSGDIADYGAAGWVSLTPVGTFIDLDAPPETDLANPSNLKRSFDFVNNLGDMVNGLASFGYGFLTDIRPEDGFVYMVAFGFRLMSVLFWTGISMALLYVLFDSGILTSKLGLALLGLGAGLGAISFAGILVD